LLFTTWTAAIRWIWLPGKYGLHTGKKNHMLVSFLYAPCFHEILVRRTIIWPFSLSFSRICRRAAYHCIKKEKAKIAVQHTPLSTQDTHYYPSHWGVTGLQTRQKLRYHHDQLGYLQTPSQAARQRPLHLTLLHLRASKVQLLHAQARGLYQHREQQLLSANM